MQTQTTVMSLKINKRLKEEAQSLSKELGFPLGTLINAFLRQFVKERCVRFSVEPQEGERRKTPGASGFSAKSIRT